jgi:hypothetical protein
MNFPEVSLFGVDSWLCYFISLGNRIFECRKVIESLGDGVILDRAG